MSTNVPVFREIQASRQLAKEWIAEFQFGEALKDLLTFPIWAIGWLLGKLWYLLLYVVGILVTSFKQGLGR
jgi:hypothetical protein